MCFSQMTLFFIYIKSEKCHELVETIQGFISLLSDWLNTNKLVSDESKTKLMIFTSRSHPVVNKESLLTMYLFFSLIPYQSVSSLLRWFV